MKKKTICTTKGCRKQAIKNRRKCSACVQRAYRKSHPIRASYQCLKDNAKRRGKFFDLTLEQFTEWCHKEDYIQGKGRTKESYSIDCIVPSRGYTIDNLQRLTVSDNAKKGVKILHYNWQDGTATVQKIIHNATGPF